MTGVNTCWLCTREVQKDESQTCSHCGRSVCNHCFVREKDVCFIGYHEQLRNRDWTKKERKFYDKVKNEFHEFIGFLEVKYSSGDEEQRKNVFDISIKIHELSDVLFNRSSASELQRGLNLIDKIEDELRTNFDITGAKFPVSCLITFSDFLRGAFTHE